jgi:hypothetical protein
MRTCAVVKTGVTVMFLGLGAAASWAADAARLGFSGTTRDLGRIGPQAHLEQRLEFENTGTALLQIRGIQTSCSCVRPEVRSLEIAPGTRASLRVELIAGAQSGPFTESLTFETNDPGQAKVTVEWKGTVFRRIEAVPDFVVMEVTPDSWTNETATVRILNHTEAPIRLSDPVGANPAFAARLSTVKPGWEYALEMRPVRALPNGNHYGRFTLRTDSTEVPQVEVTAFVPGLSALVTSPRRILLPAGSSTNLVVVPVFVRSTTGHRLVVSDPRCDAPGVRVNLEEREPGRLFVVRVEFSPGFPMTAERKLELEMRTNHPQYPVLRVPVGSRE